MTPVQFHGGFAPNMSPSASVPGYWRMRSAYSLQQVGGALWTVPDQMLTDGASVPRFFWRFIGHPFQTDLIFWAVLHDAAYRGELLKDGDLARLTRLQADNLADQLMQGIQIGPDVVTTAAWKRAMIYRTLRVFGGSNFVGVKT